MADTLFHACMRTPEAARYMAISKLTQLRISGKVPFIKIATRGKGHCGADRRVRERIRRERQLDGIDKPKERGIRFGVQSKLSTEIVRQTGLSKAWVYRAL